jgi:hypothetical protein
MSAEGLIRQFAEAAAVVGAVRVVPVKRGASLSSGGRRVMMGEKRGLADEQQDRKKRFEEARQAPPARGVGRRGEEPHGASPEIDARGRGALVVSQNEVVELFSE